MCSHKLTLPPDENRRLVSRIIYGIRAYFFQNDSINHRQKKFRKKTVTANLTQPFWLPGRACRSRYIRIPYFLPHSILSNPLLIRRTTDWISRSLRLQKITPRSSGQEGFVAHSFDSPEPYWYSNPIETRSYGRKKRVASSRREDFSTHLLFPQNLFLSW